MDARRHNITTTRSEILPDLGEGSALIKNAGSVDCDLGGSGVTAGTGFVLTAGDTVAVTRVKGTLWAITASSSTTIQVLYGSGG